MTKQPIQKPTFDVAPAPREGGLYVDGKRVTSEPEPTTEPVAAPKKKVSDGDDTD